MNRDQKEQQVAWLRNEFQDAKALFLTDFRNLKVGELNDLRFQLRNKNIKYKVLKNTLVRLAYQDSHIAAIGEDLAGTRAAAWTDSEDTVPAMAKILIDFAKTHPNLVLVRGVMNGQLVDPTEMDALSKLPSREELLAKLLGTLNAPISAFAGVLAAIPRSLLNVLKAIEDKQSGDTASEVQEGA